MLNFEKLCFENNFKRMNWNYPFGATEALFVVLFVIAYLAFIIRTTRVARKLMTRSRSWVFKFFIRIIIFGLLITALLGPSFGESELEVEAAGKDIFLVVDLSNSMNATDVTPSRLDKVKFEMNRLIQNAGNNRIGLIVFSNESFVQIPLTYDLQALSSLVQSLQTDLLPGGGSNQCSALDMAYKKLMNDGSTSNKSKIIVLLTDGEGTQSCEASLFNAMRLYGLHLYVVGVGTQNGSSILLDGKRIVDEDGKMVISKLDEKKLKKVGEQTNGTYYRLNNEVNELPQVVADINSLEGRLIDSRKISVVSNKYYYFLGIAIFLLALDVLITVSTFRL